MVEQIKAAGYDTDLQYAEDDIPNQLAQIENMITKGVDALVIAAIDGTTLSNALENAAAATASKCCVSEVGKTNDGIVSIPDLRLSLAQR